MKLRRALKITTRGGKSRGGYFEQMRGIADQLAAAGSPITDAELIRSILGGFGAEYNSFVVALTTQSTPVTLSDLHGFLLSHESLLSSQVTASNFTSDPAAYYSAQSSCGRGKGKGRRSGRGSNFFLLDQFVLMSINSSVID